ISAAPARCVLPLFSFYCPRPSPPLHSFPTRRSSDLYDAGLSADRAPDRPHQRAARRHRGVGGVVHAIRRGGRRRRHQRGREIPRDRKSTRLNSSHVKISYAVFCLKKKKKTTNRTQQQ